MATDNIFTFVLMPFHEDYDDIYRMGIKETASSLDIKAERVDEQIFQEGILERIYRQIEAADIIVADMSDQNPNVFYEVGFAHAKEKLCILLTKNPADIPFDLKHHRHIVYGGSISKLRESLTEELIWAKSQVENVRNSRIKVKASGIYGNLEKTKYAAKGEVDFKIDLHNDSNNSSSEIEAIYFYSTKRWSLKQDGKDCPHTESDIPDFDIRHFINPPIRKLHKNSWAQLRFSSTRYLGFAEEGEELKDKYRVTGRSVLRLVTPEGNFDYEIPIDVECEEFPF
jgi:nucleoside 2-deoxyribosyltransferase